MSPILVAILLELFVRKRDRASRPPIPEAEHPIVVRHPDSGRELLYVSPQITRHVVGMARSESEALLGEVHEHSTRPEFVYHHEWEVGVASPRFRSSRWVRDFA